jgi:hypothetical protein
MRLQPCQQCRQKFPRGISQIAALSTVQKNLNFSERLNAEKGWKAYFQANLAKVIVSVNSQKMPEKLAAQRLGLRSDFFEFF